MFTAHFDRHPFKLTHDLVEHPLLALPRLVELAQDLGGPVLYFRANHSINQVDDAPGEEGAGPSWTGGSSGQSSRERDDRPDRELQRLDAAPNVGAIRSIGAPRAAHRRVPRPLGAGRAGTIRAPRRHLHQLTGRDDALSPGRGAQFSSPDPGHEECPSPMAQGPKCSTVRAFAPSSSGTGSSRDIRSTSKNTPSTSTCRRGTASTFPRVTPTGCRTGRTFPFLRHRLVQRRDREEASPLSGERVARSARACSPSAPGSGPYRTR